MDIGWLKMTVHICLYVFMYCILFENKSNTALIYGNNELIFPILIVEMNNVNRIKITILKIWMVIN